MSLYIGLMSGTSLDGVDGVLVDARDGRLRAHAHRPFEAAWRAELLALNAPGTDELHRACLASNAIARRYAEVVDELLAASSTPASAVAGIGAHGQTVRHRPGEFDGTGYTVQLLNGALLAELTGIDVVCDLRSRDVAAGGQGAPLVPAFHAARFAVVGEDVAVLNLGGIANLTLLRADGTLLGFDSGPANALMDLWCERCTGAAVDHDGAWAATGAVDHRLLAAMLAEPYFERAPPKSTGRDLFHAHWLDAHLDRIERRPTEVDVQATLLELTVVTVADALSRHAARTTQLLVCGGGAFNGALMRRLASRLSPMAVASTASAGVAPDHVEAMAFAWLAQAFVEGRPGNLAEVTGARGTRRLGALYPA